MGYSWKASGNLKYLAEGLAYWRSASGWIASKVTNAKVQEVDAFFSPSLTSAPTSNACIVLTKVEAMYTSLGITCGQVGKWKDAVTGSCLDSPCSSGTAVFPAAQASSTYVDMCKAGTQFPSWTAP